MTARLDLEYDGTDFAGWARQPGLRTVEGELAGALATLLGEAVDLTVAGRTDRGVHARGQVASYDGPPADVAALNAVLPRDLVVRSSRTAPGAFDARDDAVARGYCYRVLARREPSVFGRATELWWPRALDRDLLHACASLLPGTHDFTAFTPTDGGYVHLRRTVLDARWQEAGDHLAFRIEAQSFLRHMNRTLVGTMLDVAGGRRSLESFAALLDGAARAQAGPTAAAHGLCLEFVRYPA